MHCYAEIDGHFMEASYRDFENEQNALRAFYDKSTQQSVRLTAQMWILKKQRSGGTLGRERL